MVGIMLQHSDIDDDLRRVLEWLHAEGFTGGPTEYSPPMDVFETSATVEIVADLPGVPAESIRIVCTRGIAVVAGRKLPSGCEHREAAFHLAERSFGGFARFFRLSGAIDAGRARATLVSGELHVIIPRIEERRGREIRIPIVTE
jgi:HSP20 family protein